MLKPLHIQLEQTLSLSGHSAEIQSVAFARANGCIVTGSQDRTVGIWDAESGQLLHRLGLFDVEVWAVSASLEAGQVVANTSRQTIEVWDVAIFTGMSQRAFCP